MLLGHEEGQAAEKIFDHVQDKNNILPEIQLV